jgi:tetratricopeptide (TPR) repeat protein
MFNLRKTVVLALSLVLSSNFAFAELSSKAKKAEKLASSGRVPEAVEIYKELMSKDPKKNADLVKEGREGMAACLLRGVKESIAAKKYEEAKSGSDNILTNFKETPAAQEAAKYIVTAELETSKVLIDAKKYDACILELKTIKDKIPAGNDAVLADLNKILSKLSADLLKMAQDNIKQAKCDEAMANLTLALASSVEKEGSAQCKYAMGVCFRLTKQTDKAVSAYQEVVTNFTGTTAVAPAFADLYLLDLQLDNKQDALNAIKQAVSTDPSNSDYLFKEAKLLYDLGKNDDAQKIAKKLIPMLQAEIEKTYLGKENLQYKLGMSKLILGNFTEAAVEFDKALTRNPDMLEAKKSLALAQFNDKNYTGAVTTYDSLIKQVTSLFDDANDKASKEKDSNDLAKKVEDLRKDIAFFHYQKGLSYEQLKDLDKAQAECRLGFEGVSTEEAAATLKRIQSQANQIKTQEPVQK